MYTSINAAPDQFTTKIKFPSPYTQNLPIIFSLFKPGENDGKVDMIWTFLNIRLKAEPAQMCFGEVIYIYPKSTSALFQLSFDHTNGRTLL